MSNPVFRLPRYHEQGGVVETIFSGCFLLSPFKNHCGLLYPPFPAVSRGAMLVCGLLLLECSRTIRIPW